MPLLPGFRSVTFVVIALALASCQTVTPKPSANRASFKANYMVARTALEGGQFSKAARGYANLLVFRAVAAEDSAGICPCVVARGQI